MTRIMSGRGFVDFLVISKPWGFLSNVKPEGGGDWAGKSENSVSRTGLRMLKIKLNPEV
jgi:hypothetical protein